MKGETKVINFEGFKNEKALRTTIKKNLNKEYHASTKCSIDFIFKNLEDAYNGGLKYDVSDMYNAVLAFAMNSTNNSDYCIKLVKKMHFKSEEPSIPESSDKDSLIFYDVEVFPNLFLVNWKMEGADKPVVRMINPSPSAIEDLLHYKLVGFNCRRYDNHMLYARLMGYTEEQLYNLSQKIINSKKGENQNAFFGEAYITRLRTSFITMLFYWDKIELLLKKNNILLSTRCHKIFSKQQLNDMLFHEYHLENMMDDILLAINTLNDVVTEGWSSINQKL